MKKEYCLTNEYPGVCWAYKMHNQRPRIFYECGPHYEKLDIPIKGVVKLTFKKWCTVYDVK